MKTNLFIQSRNLFCIVMLIATSTIMSQETPRSRVVSFSELSSIFDKKYANPDQSKVAACPWIASANIFPINGCHTFTVTQTVNYVFGSTQISTTVKVCCTCGICVPYMGRIAGGNEDKLPKSVRILNSSSVKFDKYDISIASGSYEVDSAGNYVNLKFSVVEN